MNKADFDLHFDLAFRSYTTTRFEQWFADMAACVFGSDFELIKAGGKQGDKKSDGRRISTETVYQCYAPESPRTFSENAKRKILDSFPEVTQYWPKLKQWVLVHNNEDGLPPAASDTLEELREQYPELDIVAPPARRFLKDQFHDRLSLQQMVDLYPAASMNFMAVKMEDIQPLLRKVISDRNGTPTDSLEFGELPDEAKLDFNLLSPDAKYDLKRARPHISIVDRYLAGMSNPQHASLLQSRMTDKYKEAKELGYSADEILGKLLAFVGGDGTPTYNAAAYVILTYYFESCDIFENVPKAELC